MGQPSAEAQASAKATGEVQPKPVESDIKELRHRLFTQVFRQFAKGRIQAALIGAKQIEALTKLELESAPERSVFGVIAAVTGGTPDEVQLAAGGQRLPRRFFPGMSNITSVAAEKTDLYRKYGIVPVHEDFGILVCLAEHESLKPSREFIHQCGFKNCETVQVYGVDWAELFG